MNSIESLNFLGKTKEPFRALRFKSFLTMYPIISENTQIRAEVLYFAARVQNTPFMGIWVGIQLAAAENAFHHFFIHRAPFQRARQDFVQKR